MKRITEAQLENEIASINRITKMPDTPYSHPEGIYTLNPGNFHLYQANGGHGLHRITMRSTHQTIFTLTTKRELYSKLTAFKEALLLVKYEGLNLDDEPTKEETTA